MKVMFVSGGNSITGISSIVLAQAKSLKEFGVEVDHFAIKGKGIGGYLGNVRPLRKKLKASQYDLVHAHFSFCGFVSTMAGAKPLVVSLMGWNVRKPLLKIMIKLFNRFSWDKCIVKSARMKKSLGDKDLVLLPNGVNLEIFRPMDKQEARERLNWPQNETHILFAANPNRPIKNFPLARQAFELFLKNTPATLHVLNKVKHEEMPYLYNAADLVLLTSKAEGSPNVIKEAMACNCVIVSTDVGDVKERFSDNPACFLCTHDAADISEKLQKALAFSGAPNTRNEVLDLDSKHIASELYRIYQNILEQGGH